MIIPAFLLRLIPRGRLSTAILTRLGAEERLSIQFADACRAWTLEGRLRGIWFHCANEAGGGSDKKKRQIQMAKAIALGMIPGMPDYVFIANVRTVRHDVLLLELKSTKGTQSQTQKDFQAWAESAGVEYRIAKSFEQAEAALLDAGLLSPARKGSTAHAI